MATVTYYDRERDELFRVELPVPGSIWERVPNIKDVIPKGMGMRLRDVPKRVRVVSADGHVGSLVKIKVLPSGKDDGFHPYWFLKYYQEVQGE